MNHDGDTVLALVWLAVILAPWLAALFGGMRA